MDIIKRSFDLILVRWRKCERSDMINWLPIDAKYEYKKQP